MSLTFSMITIILWPILGIFIKPCFDTKYSCDDDNSKTIIYNKKDDNNTIRVSVAKREARSLLFNWNKAEMTIAQSWATIRLTLLNRLKENEKLEIAGLYRANKAEPANFENLGIAKAATLSKLFIPPLTDDRINMSGKLINPTEEDKTNMFKSVGFKTLKTTAAIREIGDRTLFYFPFSSTDNLKGTESQSYLNDIEGRVKKSGKKIRVSGHTDSIGSLPSNIQLDQRGANIAKQYLIGRKAHSSNINAESKQETQPTCGAYVNNKKSAENRRAKLQITK